MPARPHERCLTSPAPYAVEPGVPLLAMGVLYLLVVVALMVVPAIRQRCRAVSMVS